MTGAWGAPPFVDVPLMTQISIPAGDAAATSIIEAYKYQKLTFYVRASDNCTVYVKGGPTDDLMCVLKSGDLGVGSGAQDADLSWTCNNETICFQISTHLSLAQILIVNGGSGAALVDLAMSGN